MYSSPGNAESSVNIIIKATDKSADVFKNAEKLVQDLGDKVSDLSKSFSDFSASISKSTTSTLDAVLGRINNIAQAIDFVQGLVRSDAGVALFTAIENNANDALYATTSLSEGLKNTAKALTPALETFVGLEGKSAKIGSGLGQVLGEGLTASFKTQLSSSLDAFDGFVEKAIAKSGKVAVIGNAVGSVGNLAGGLAGIGEPLSIFSDIQNATTGVVDSINNTLGRFTVLSSVFETLKGAVLGGPFDMLIGQNVRLREQLLATQSSLVSTNKIFLEGQQIKDPTTAIQALSGSVNDAIARIRKGSLELVGVTSGQLVDTFQIVAGQASQIGISLSQASDLTLSFAATMGTMNLPLNQARQEITSIASGTIDMNSVLAKSLGITNAMVTSWKASGTTFAQLTKRMEAFKAGNALAAQTISGVTSNIQEIFDEIGRKAGEPLLEPIVAHLNNFYNYLKENMQVLSDEISKIVQTLFTAGESMLAAFMAVYQAIIPILSQVPTYLVDSIASLVTQIADSIQGLLPILQSAINVLGQIIKHVSVMGGPLFKLAIQAKVLQAAISGMSYGFGSVLKILPGVGEVLFLMQGRTANLVKGFFSLSKQIGPGAAAFLSLGKNMEMIPGIARLLERRFGSLAPLIQQFLPKIAGVAMQTVAFSKNFAPAGEAVVEFAKKTHGSINSLADVVENSNFMGGIFKPLAQGMRDASDSVKPYIENIKNATFFNEKFAEVSKQVALATRKQMLAFGLIGASIFALFFVLDKFILNNKNFMRTLEEMGKILQNVGAAIWTFLTNPFVVATGVLAGLGVAIKAGLIPQVLAMAQAFAGTATAAIASFWATATAGVSSFSEGIKSTSVTFSSFLDMVDMGEKRQTEVLRKSLEEQSEAYEAAILERKQQIQSLSDQVAVAFDESMSDPSPASDSNLHELIEQQKAAQVELDEIVAERQAQFQTLSEMEAKSYQKELPKAAAALRSHLADQAELYDQAIEQRTAQIEQLSQQIDDRDEKRQEKQRTADLKSNLAEQSGAYQAAILERKQQIQSLSDQVAVAFDESMSDPSPASDSNVHELIEQQKAAQVELDEMVAERQAQIKTLAEMEAKARLEPEPDRGNPFLSSDSDFDLEAQKQAIQADMDEMVESRQTHVKKLADMDVELANMGPPPTVGQRFSDLGDTIKTKTVGSFEALKTSAKSMSWSGMVDGLGSVKTGAIAAGTALKANLVGSFKTIMADIGPMILMVGAIFAVTQAVGTYTTLMDASTKSSQDFAAATQEATDKLNLLLASQQKASAIDTGKDRAEERLGEIKKEQGMIGGFMEFLRNSLNFVAKTIASLINPFIWVRTAAEQFGSALSSVWNGLKSMPVIGNLIQGIEGLGNAMGQALAPVKAFFQPVLDLLGRFGEGVKTVWDFLSQPPQFTQSAAESQLNGEIEGYTKTMEDAQTKLAQMAKSTTEVTAERKKLMELNNAQAAARAKGDDAAVAAIQKDIDKTKEIIDARKAEADAVIAGLEAQKAPTEAHKIAQSQLIEQAKELKRSWEDNATIKPPDLAELGSAYDQIASKASSAATSVQKMLSENSGAADQLRLKAQEVLDFTAQQQQMGLITSDEAIARYRMLATSTKIDADLQIKAQQAITEAYKTEGDERVAEVQRHQSEIEALIARGVLGEAEGERRLTAEKKKELETRLEDLKTSKDKEQEIRYQNLQTDLSTQNDLIAAAQGKLKTPNMKPKDKREQTDAIDAANQKKLDLEGNYNKARDFANTKYTNESQKITTDLAKNEAETLKQANAEKLKNFEEAQAALDGLKAQGLKTDEEFAEESKKNNDSRFAEELKQIAEQREKLDPNDKEGLEALATKEAEVRKKMADSRGDYYDKMSQAAQDDAQEEITALEGLKAEGLKTDEEFAQGSLDITRKRLEAELVLLAEQKKLLDPKDEEGLQKIAAKEAAIQKQIADSRNTFYEQMITAAKKDAEERTAILEGQKVAGLISEKDYNQQSFDLATEALDKEQALLEKKRSELKAGDEEGQEAIAAQEGDIQKRRLEATKNFYQKQLAVSERARQKLLDAATEAETESQIQIQGLLNSGAIKQEEAESLKLNATEKRIQEELRLEEQKLAELSSMPSYSDPEAEDERQQQIRASRQRTHELTLQVAENEYARQEKIRAQQEKALDKQAQRIANDAEGQAQAWSAQSTEIENINRSLELQNKILDSGKSYLEARSNLITTELDVLSKLTKSGAEQKDIAKLKASIEIRVLDIKQRGELAALKLQQEQTANALKREEIENRIAQIKNQAEVAQKTVNLQKLALNPNASAEERQAAQLDLQASLQTGSALREAGMLVGDQQAMQSGLNRNELAAMRMRQRGEDISARGALVETLSGGQRRAATQALQRQILGDLGLGDGSGGVRAAAQSLTSQTLNSALGLGDGRANERTPGNFRFETPNGRIPTRAAPRRTRFDERAEDQAVPPAPAPRRSFNERYEAPRPPSAPAAPRTPALPTPSTPGTPYAPRTLLPPVNLTAQGRSPDFSAVTASNEKLVTVMTGLKTAVEAFGKINFSQSNEINNNFGRSGATPARETDRVLNALYDVATKIRQSR